MKNDEIITLNARFKVSEIKDKKHTDLPMAIIAFLMNEDDKVYEREYYVIKEKDFIHKYPEFLYEIKHDFSFTIFKNQLPETKKVKVKFLIVFSVKKTLDTDSCIYKVSDHNYPVYHIPDTTLVYEYNKKVIRKEETT